MKLAPYTLPASTVILQDLILHGTYLHTDQFAEIIQDIMYCPAIKQEIIHLLEILYQIWRRMNRLNCGFCPNEEPVFGRNSPSCLRKREGGEKKGRLRHRVGILIAEGIEILSGWERKKRLAYTSRFFLGFDVRKRRKSLFRSGPPGGPPAGN